MTSDLTPATLLMGLQFAAPFVLLKRLPPALRAYRVDGVVGSTTKPPMPTCELGRPMLAWVQLSAPLAWTIVPFVNRRIAAAERNRTATKLLGFGIAARRIVEHCAHAQNWHNRSSPQSDPHICSQGPDRPLHDSGRQESGRRAALHQYRAVARSR